MQQTEKNRQKSTTRTNKSLTKLVGWSVGRSVNQLCMSTAGASIFLFELFSKKKLESICCTSYEMNAGSWVLIT